MKQQPRDAMISRSIVDQYFSILEDTLVGFLLPAYRPKAKVREQGHPVFYYRTKNGVEVDFLIELKKATLSKPAEVISIEVKLANKWDSRWFALQPLLALATLKLHRVQCGLIRKRIHNEDFG